MDGTAQFKRTQATDRDGYGRGLAPSVISLSMQPSGVWCCSLTADFHVCSLLSRVTYNEGTDLYIVLWCVHMCIATGTQVHPCARAYVCVCACECVCVGPTHSRYFLPVKKTQFVSNDFKKNDSFVVRGTQTLYIYIYAHYNFILTSANISVLNNISLMVNIQSSVQIKGLVGLFVLILRQRRFECVALISWTTANSHPCSKQDKPFIRAKKVL